MIHHHRHHTRLKCDIIAGTDLDRSSVPLEPDDLSDKLLVAHSHELVHSSAGHALGDNHCEGVESKPRHKRMRHTSAAARHGEETYLVHTPDATEGSGHKTRNRRCRKQERRVEQPQLYAIRASCSAANVQQEHVHTRVDHPIGKWTARAPALCAEMQAGTRPALCFALRECQYYPGSCDTNAPPMRTGKNTFCSLLSRHALATCEHFNRQQSFGNAPCPQRTRRVPTRPPEGLPL